MSTATKAKPKIKIQPLEDRVVILPAEEAETMRGGLYIPDTAKEKPTQGEVIAVGPGPVREGRSACRWTSRSATRCSTGSTAAPVSRSTMTKLIILKASDILAKIG